MRKNRNHSAFRDFFFNHAAALDGLESDYCPRVSRPSLWLLYRRQCHGWEQRPAVVETMSDLAVVRDWANNTQCWGRGPRSASLSAFIIAHKQLPVYSIIFGDGLWGIIAPPEHRPLTTPRATLVSLVALTGSPCSSGSNLVKRSSRRSPGRLREWVEGQYPQHGRCCSLAQNVFVDVSPKMVPKIEFMLT